MAYFCPPVVIAQICTRMGFFEHKRTLNVFNVLYLFIGLGSLTGLTFFKVVAVLASLVALYAFFRVRARIRAIFMIPGSTLEDVATTMCCSCCSLAQMATHVESYQPGSCSFQPRATLEGYSFK